MNSYWLGTKPMSVILTHGMCFESLEAVVKESV